MRQKGNLVSAGQRRGRRSGDGGDKLAPCEVFDVPEEVRHLDSAGLVCLERSYRCWRDGAGRADRVRSRTRVLLLFLMLRHSGAKLGEILDIDVRQSVDAARAVVTLGNEKHRRDVPLPRTYVRELMTFVDGPMGTGLDGKVFALDPGYIRRIFYARAEDSGIDRSLGSPAALRRSRAVELLRSGVPLGVVREVLGQSRADLAAVFQRWSEGDVQSIVRRMSVSEKPLRTSARNTFSGHVTQVKRDGVMAEVELATASGRRVTAVITTESLDALDLEPGVPVAATVKAPHVDVFAMEEPRAESARNSFAAKVSSVRGTEVLTEVTGVAEDGAGLCALVSTSAFSASPFDVGDAVEFRFKALAVVLHTL